MKPAFGLALSQLLYGIASACAGGFIPAYHYYNISQNPDVSQEDRDWALFHYNNAKSMVEVRRSAPSTGSGESIASNDDDGQYSLEQDPSDAEALAEEEVTLEISDQEDVNPDLVEPDEDNGEDDPADFDVPEEDMQRRSFGSFSRRKATAGMNQIGKRQGGVANRFTYSNNRGCAVSPPSALARKEGSPVSADRDVNLAFEGTGLVDALYRQVYRRAGQDGRGRPLRGVVHFCNDYGNALWDGVMLLFGDGDGRFFRFGGFVRSLDVIGHEYTHGVIQFSNPLYYYGQSGALNEHLSDVFGVLSEQYYRRQTAAQASWLLGQGLINGGVALRSMSAPGTAYRNTPGGSDQQRANMAQYYAGSDDNQGVHINSGIPNRAFYIFATTVGGNAWEVPGRIWYDVLVGGRGRFNYQGETFSSFAQRTLASAGALYGGNVRSALLNAWQQVGVL